MTRSALLFVLPALVVGTSSKMDFLPLGHVRTDPVTDRDTCNGAPGLAPHVHTFYGAAASLRPTTEYEEMRNACGNSGNVDDNKSLYWHPTIYRFDKSTGLYHIEDIYFASAYYVWRTPGEDLGEGKNTKTTAFKDGFQMIARQSSGPKARVMFDCNGPSACERTGEDCTPLHTCADVSRDTDNVVKMCFPTDQCSELEIKIVFPSCSDGSLTSADHMSHMAYPEGDWTTQEGAYDAECPSTHPYRVPEIQLYFRIRDYKGGAYTFSDSTTEVHADYFSGWVEAELQKTLDECVNDGQAAMSNRWCETHFKFRDEPKLDPDAESGPKGSDERIVTMLRELQPNPALDLMATVSAEKITGVSQIPMGRCTGLLPADPSKDWKSTPNCTLLGNRSTASPAACTPECSLGFVEYPLCQQDYEVCRGAVDASDPLALSIGCVAGCTDTPAMAGLRPVAASIAFGASSIADSDIGSSSGSDSADEVMCTYSENGAPCRPFEGRRLLFGQQPTTLTCVCE